MQRYVSLFFTFTSRSWSCIDVASFYRMFLRVRFARWYIWRMRSILTLHVLMLMFSFRQQYISIQVFIFKMNHIYTGSGVFIMTDGSYYSWQTTINVSHRWVLGCHIYVLMSFRSKCKWHNCKKHATIVSLFDIT